MFSRPSGNSLSTYKAFLDQLSLPHPLQETLRGIFYFFVYIHTALYIELTVTIIGSILEVTVL